MSSKPKYEIIELLPVPGQDEQAKGTESILVTFRQPDGLVTSRVIDKRTWNPLQADTILDKLLS